MRPFTPDLLLQRLKTPPQCLQGDCHLWLISAKVDDPELEVFASVLSAEEQARVNSFRLKQDRIRFVVGRGGLRRLVSAYTSTPPSLVPLGFNPEGKPHLVSSAIEFNVSHAEDCVLIAICYGAQCGVDIECGQANIEEEAISSSLFCARELDWLSKTECGFLRLWTTKEAVVKALGGGLSIPLNSFDVTDLLRGEVPTLQLRTPQFGTQTLWVKELALVPGYASAVACVGAQFNLSVIGEQV